MKKIQKYLNESNKKWNKKDTITILIILLIYGILSFYHLGNVKSPNTFHDFQENQEVIVELNQAENINNLISFSGFTPANYQVYLSKDGLYYDYIGEIKGKYCFTWEELEMKKNAKYLKIKFLEESSLGEIGLFNKDQNQIVIKKVIGSRKIKKLYDEQDTVPFEISNLNSMYFDEIYFARTAYEYTKGLDTYEWTHPPLGKLIQAIPIYLTGYFSPFTYRLMSNLSGIIMILMMYLFGRELFHKRKYAILSSLILAFDTFHFAQTRIGTVDSHLVLFLMISVYFMIQFTKKNERKYLLLSAVFFTAMILTKWSGLYGGLALAIIYFYDLIKKKKLSWKWIGYGTLFFIIMPIVCCFTIYLLFPNNKVVHTNSISKVLLQQQKMYEYHSNLDKEHAFSSKWYSWPFCYKPVWFYTHLTKDGKKGTISTVGNIVIWWVGIISFFYLLYDIFKKKNKNSLLLVIIILSLWLPYALIPRIMFLYHYFSVIPFLILGTVKMLEDVWTNKKIKWLFYCYLISMMIFFIVYYPIVSGKPLDIEWIDRLKLFPSWYF